jgi:hypothetical protein
MSLKNVITLPPLELEQSADKSAEVLKKTRRYTARTHIDAGTYFPELNNIIVTLNGLVQGCVESAIAGTQGRVVQPIIGEDGMIVVINDKVAYQIRTGNVEFFLEEKSDAHSPSC